MSTNIGNKHTLIVDVTLSNYPNNADAEGLRAIKTFLEQKIGNAFASAEYKGRNTTGTHAIEITYRTLEDQIRNALSDW